MRNARARWGRLCVLVIFAPSLGQADGERSATPPVAADPHAEHHDPAPTKAPPEHAPPHLAQPHADHEMWTISLGRDWHLVAMAQAFPVVTFGAPFERDGPLRRTRIVVTQSAAMLNVESPGSRVTLRVTPNLEGATLPDGELTFGAWGEGFIDARHPHTLLHEAMLSLNLWDVGGAALSISAGKGFAPYGTDDPMARPVLKFPTNHHLSQILERWTLNGVALYAGWGVEAGVFGGEEPHHPYDFGNIRTFGDSFSARLSRRLGEGFGPMAEWEVSASYARVRGAGGAEEGVTALYNAAVRHAGTYDFGTVYALVEGSLGQPEVDDSYFSVLGETQVELRRHQPYYRVEYATRPEFARQGPPGTAAFFRYDHDAPAIGATRWLINSAGYGYTLTGYPMSARLFAEVQHHHVWEERGGIRPTDLFGTNDFWSISVGMRVFLGGAPMRMGTYGVLDPMTVMHREMTIEKPPVAPAPRHHGH